MKLREYPDAEMMMMDLADQISSELTMALETHEAASFCVPGGSTPGPVFDLLAGRKSLDWSRVTVFLNDERWVPEDSPRSNTRLIRERLLTGPAAAANYVPLYAPADRPEDAMEGLAEGIAPHLPISVLLLGMGADMHTASLFPGADRLTEALSDEAPILLPMRAEAADEPRITLSAPVLQGALSTHILITGEAKLSALERARHLSPAEAPVKCVLGEAVVHWAP
ncbi:MAG: 6-phosphogluconolactonase [Vannielia sp.]|uniref:6-phosphogluconolactonase n=1 Tax=Rhodobacterales TaxID=204455 RepID=UPI002094F0D3|nr:6-phosphogluconolactonase [Oceanicola sp. 502str15]MCO6382190.1 6-phosphogluconolactonase [Oceanicola sp. 502str15]